MAGARRLERLLGGDSRHKGMKLFCPPCVIFMTFLTANIQRSKS